MRNHEQQLLQPLLDYFSAHNQARLLGPADATIRAPTVTVALPEPAESIAARLASQGIMAAGGDFYAVRVIQAMQEDPAHGVLRMSFVHYTSKEEINKLIHVLDREI
jgi:selenocysteine lyase/cysteine desulfurase